MILGLCMKRKLLYTLMFTSVFGLVSCAGGGGGGGGANNPGNSYPTPGGGSGGGGSSGGGGGGGGGSGGSGGGGSGSTYNVNAPATVGTINPLVTPSVYGSSLNMYTADLTNTGSQNVILAGGETHNNNLTGPADAANWINSKLRVYGWSNGQLVDQTSAWFSGTDNVITGTPRVSFGNFAGNNRQSMFIAPGTDGILNSSTVQMFVNNGSSFTRYDVALPHTIDSTDSAVFTYNGVDNAIALAYPFSEVVMGSPTNNFHAYSVGNVSGSSIAAGNFLGTGAPSFVVTDSAAGTTLGAKPNNLFDFHQDPVTGAVTMNLVGQLPTPIFNTAPYFATTGGSNATRVMKMDFDGSGIDSVFIVSMPNNYQNSQWKSSIQFLKNNGAGTFTDVTSTTVTGYDMTKTASTNPVIIDLLNTGLPDIVLPAPGANQVLMQVSKGQYVASMANTITNFTGQVQGLLTSGQTSANSTVTFVQGPGNNLYLLGMVPETINGTAQNGFYLSQVTGGTVALNAQQAINIARTTWPWLTDTQLNTMIKATGSSYAGVPVINEQALFSPDGALTIGNKPITGYIAGLNMNGADSNVTTVDQLGRTFSASLMPTHMSSWSNSFNMDSEHIDQYELTSHTEYLINGAVNNAGPMRIGAETRNMYNTFGGPESINYGPTLNQTRSYTFGIPKIWQNGNWSAGVQYTNLNYNPWLAFGGSWGMVNQSGNLDHTIRYTENGFSAVVGGTYTTTNITPGLITKVNDIYGVWGETGYRFANDVGVYVGVKPVVVSGNVTANLPTGVDSNGNSVYTSKTLGLQNQTTSYVRALWGTALSKQTMYRISGTAMSNGQYRLMNELRYSFD